VAKDPVDWLREDVREFLEICRSLVQRVTVVEENVKDLKWIYRLIAGAVILSIIAAVVALLKGGSK
jgi:hypothetical protein